MSFSVRSGWFAVGAVGLFLGCGPQDAPDESKPVGAVGQELANTCQNTSASYTFECATVHVYKTATSTTPIDTIHCGGAYWVATLLQACPSNGRFKVEYGKDFDPTPATGWIDRTHLVATR
ncbi:hypothetical protein [Melittangium boletus]|uniref:Lipoprotein n=1 Tax=Melittangium boletus DSM 14713 TaxID=1294270 RepID=A0A250INE0_9BACT|nr:hypothetical protein [Melittangium boletus]ATB32742.1 hypothetical protein MEBOL_006231 [Melittangium boletus DSM 14713]